MYCAHCRNKLDPINTWKGSNGDLFCSEFCAEEEQIFSPNLAPEQPRLPQINYGREREAA